jgi:hypothetical protein
MMKSTKPETRLLESPAPDQVTEDAGVVETPVPKSPVDIAVNRVLQDFDLVYSQDKKVYAVDRTTRNPTTYRVGSLGFASVIRQRVYLNTPGLALKDEQLSDAQGHVAALAELKGELASIWLRVAKTERGLEIDIGDDSHARISIEPGRVAILTEGSQTLFERNPNFLPFVMPAEVGDIRKLLQYLNLTEREQWLVIAWITYTLAHPKIPSSNYVFLVLRGERGSGKSTMSSITLGSLVGPSVIGVQAFPGSAVDLAIAVQNSHVVFYDNLRKLTPFQADNLCRCATGASLSTRLFYTNGGEYTHTMHGVTVLNGIHPFIDQADLAQRCLALTLQPLSANDRTTERQLQDNFQQDLPAIFRGVLDLIADILTHLPDVTATYPERMLEFVHWLAAMEKALGLPEGQLQRSYSDNLIGAMQDTLQDNPLADAVMQFAQKPGQVSWTGTPTELLVKLGEYVPAQIIPTVEWPQNEVSMSRRLNQLKSQLSGAGVEVVVGRRSRLRQISVTYTGKSS